MKEVRDCTKGLLEIAVAYGFSSHEAFTRAFRGCYGVTPSAYRKKPTPLVLRTKISPFDRYFFGLGEIGMIQSKDDIKIYFVTIPAHKFLYISNYESNGYWNFWQKQNLISGQDYATISGLLDSIKGKLDDDGGSEVNCISGQIMAYINHPKGRLCDWGINRIECWGVRLPQDYQGDIPFPLALMDIPEGEYIVFEHGPFHYDQENHHVEEKIEMAMKTFDYAATGYLLDTTPGRTTYFYYAPERYFKYIRLVKRLHMKDMVEREYW